VSAAMQPIAERNTATVGTATSLKNRAFMSPPL
jgi:hypothetical protein